MFKPRWLNTGLIITHWWIKTGVYEGIRPRHARYVKAASPTSIEGHFCPGGMRQLLQHPSVMTTMTDAEPMVSGSAGRIGCRTTTGYALT